MTLWILILTAVLTVLTVGLFYFEFSGRSASKIEDAEKLSVIQVPIK
jgi:hypothetical protein